MEFEALCLFVFYISQIYLGIYRYPIENVLHKTEKVLIYVTGKFSHGFGLDMAIFRGLNAGVILSIFRSIFLFMLL